MEALEQAVTSLGGNPCYVSAAARAVEGMDSNLLESTFMLSGAIDPMTAEMAMLDAVFVAESLTSAQNATLSSFVDRLPDGPSREVLADLVATGAAQQRRLEWILDTKVDVATAELSSTAFERVGQKFEQIAARVHNWLS